MQWILSQNLLQNTGVEGVEGWGCNRTPKVLIWWKPDKLHLNQSKISENLLKLLGNLGKNGAQCALIWKQWRPNWHEQLFLEVTWRPNWHEELILEVKYFSGKCGRIRAKFLRTPKTLPAPKPMTGNVEKLNQFKHVSPGNKSWLFSNMRLFFSTSKNTLTQPQKILYFPRNCKALRRSLPIHWTTMWLAKHVELSELVECADELAYFKTES